MELLVLLAIVLLGLSVLIRRSTYGTSRRAPPPPAPAPAVLHKISDPSVAHRVLVDDAGAFSNRPVLPFFVNLAKRRGGRRSENISTAPYGPHWRALRCNITAETFHPSRLGLGRLAPLQREAIQDLVAALSVGAAAGAGKEQGAVVVVREHLRAAVFRVIVRLCFRGAVDECHIAQQRKQRRLMALHGRITELCLPLVGAWRQRESPQPYEDDGGRRPYVDTLIELRVPEEYTGSNKGGGRRALTDEEVLDLVLRRRHGVVGGVPRMDSRSVADPGFRYDQG
ncbi:hypothetical protein ACQ4PT_002651 [Festuca glaucescens]